VAENILKLKKKAVDAGMAKADAMKADRAALEAFLAQGENGAAKKATAKKVVKKAVVKKAPAAAKAPAKKAAAKAAPAKPKAGTRKVTRKVVTPKIDSDALGRLNIDTIDWTVESDEWNPRKGGPVEKLFKALKKSKGNIDKAYAMISSAPHEFVGKTKRDGTKRSKAEIEATLRYRLNRTKWEYGIRTGQHASADPKNRAQYGTGDYATTRKVKPARKVTAKKTAAKPKAAKAAGRKKATTKK
jgi:hypothetical protein